MYRLCGGYAFRQWSEQARYTVDLDRPPRSFQLLHIPLRRHFPLVTRYSAWGEVRFAGERRGQQQLSRSVYDDQVAETVRMVLSQQRTLMEPVEEVKELLRVLDSVEWRMSKLRDEIRGVIEESSSVRENTALKGDEID